MSRPRLAVFLIFASPLWPQRVPVDAKTSFYFPQVVDGGPPSGQWQTTITIVNPVVGRFGGATLMLDFVDDRGADFKLDFGEGPNSSHWPWVPPGGSLVMRSRMTSANVRTGYAVATSMSPLQVTISFRLFVNGRAVQEVTAPPTWPTLDYVVFANRATGVALANPPHRMKYQSVNIDAKFLDADGHQVSDTVRINLPPRTHTAFNLWDLFPQIGTREGVLVLKGVDRSFDTFIAWSMNTDPSGTFSSQPGGTFEFPVDHEARIRDVYARISGTTSGGFSFGTPDSPSPTAYCCGEFGEVLASHSLSELLAASESELAFILAHMYGHSFQGPSRTRRIFESGDAEIDADMWGIYLCMKAGYDPYAGMGALAKLAQATGSAGLTTSFDSQPARVANESLNARLQGYWATMTRLCQMYSQLCTESKSLIHPKLENTPLGHGMRPPAY